MDNGASARSLGKLYKIVVPLPSANRSVETSATLFDADNNAIMSFVVRTHGNREGGSMPWPDYGDGDYGTNALSSNGNTPTGLMYIDLNSPEPTDYEDEYGPYPINRVVKGVEGNAGLVLSESASLTGSAMRSGILLHTGEWPGWDAAMAMPNSDGCIHAHPDDVAQIWQSLVALGVVGRENP